ncbi:CsbD family protein [Pseudomonas spirodelae]|uniref:Uncharacterized protein n=1 Tax=Pseudomonas spirodelae TaxID=3101751 RepID=A0ABU5PDS5_9PSED|nr:hypothetical protein [Pseudomonas sp. T5W1]MEA1607663.1 hypothetical protein [Pseudomonas sp. T5W1]
MSLQRLQCLHGQWRQSLGALQMTWARLNHNPALHHAGHMQHLAGLLQARYGFSRADAEAQVSVFFAHKGPRDNGAA